MLHASMASFFSDQRGGGTIMGLLWFVLMVGITGLAVDSTNGFRARTMLQATADATALAAAIITRRP
jgi:Flp pilus assembly protein TadG